MGFKPISLSEKYINLLKPMYSQLIERKDKQNGLIPNGKLYFNNHSKYKKSTPYDQKVFSKEA